MSILTKTIDWIFKGRKAREDNNKYVLGQMAMGRKDMGVVPPESTWFPPRPLIKKDAKTVNLIRRRRYIYLAVDNTTKEL